MKSSRCTLPDLSKMTQAQLRKWRFLPKRCSGPCDRLLTNADFAMTSCRGKPLHRTWCRACLKEYYTVAKAKQREKSKYPRVDPADARERKKLALVYSVVPNGKAWDVQRTLNASAPVVVSSHLTEQEAEREVKKRREALK
jgi:hypothetical protein